MQNLEKKISKILRKEIILNDKIEIDFKNEIINYFVSFEPKLILIDVSSVFWDTTNIQNFILSVENNINVIIDEDFDLLIITKKYGNDTIEVRKTNKNNKKNFTYIY